MRIRIQLIGIRITVFISDAEEKTIVVPRLHRNIHVERPASGSNACHPTNVT
jgi:hypothetical protein